MTAVRILSGGAAQGLVEAVRPAFEAETGCTIDGTFGAVGAMRARLIAGDAADVVILTQALIAALASAGHVVGASAVNVGSVQTAVAARQGDPAPPIGDAAALRQALLGADAIYMPDPQQATAGIHFAKVMRDLGVWQDVVGRLQTFSNGATAMRELAGSRYRRPLGCTQATEIIATPGVTVIAPLPPGCALATVYTAALTPSAASTASRLIALLTDPAGRDTRRQAGFD
ncbi:MAG: substrate-binding domain-containing protein [Alphaproteobacteria bacterium]|nr:substrate-binding domain-containing protein [Alphaproteobacteria bacterium]